MIIGWNWQIIKLLCNAGSFWIFKLYTKYTWRYEADQKCCSSPQHCRTRQLRNLPLLKEISEIHQCRHDYIVVIPCMIELDAWRLLLEELTKMQSLKNVLQEWHAYNYKNNGAVSCIGADFLFIWSLYLPRTQLLALSRGLIDTK